MAQIATTDATSMIPTSTSAAVRRPPVVPRRAARPEQTAAMMIRSSVGSATMFPMSTQTGVGSMSPNFSFSAIHSAAPRITIQPGSTPMSSVR